MELPLKKLYSGKVRELYDIDAKTMLLVASDRISAFDFILPTPIPGKGAILTQLSGFWFRRLKNVIENHVVEDRLEKFPENIRGYAWLKGRAAVVRKAEKFPIECVVRGYLAGSGWREYGQSKTVCGIKLPLGLRLAQELPEPVFTPATKEDMGKHDMNIPFGEMKKIIGENDAVRLKEKSLQLYREAAAYAKQKGIIIADTKFEFGRVDGNIILIDEVFTPDSSRFWEQDKYAVGSQPESLDKQYIRDYLEAIRWNKQPPVPALPDEVVKKTLAKYRQVYEILTGSKPEL